MPEGRVAELLRGIELFSALEPASLSQLVVDAESVFVPGGEVLMREGDPSDALYIVASGRLQAFVSSDGGEVLVGEIQRGEAIGEMGILADEPRSATVRALRDSSLFRFPKEKFVQFLHQHPGELLAITQLVIQRLRRSIRSTPVASSVQTIAVVPIAGDDGAIFARLLTAAISERGSARLLGRGDVDETLSDAEMTAYLDRLEGAHDLLVYLADPEPSGWTQRCLRQADRVVLVAETDADSSLTDVERSLLFGPNSVRARVDLVLTVPDHQPRPSPARRWLQHRSVRRHYHMHLHSRDHLHRIARGLTGREIALVLSGGGARGIAHVGINKAMAEYGIPIDVVGGSSFGSLVGAQIATGASWSEQRDVMFDLLVAKGSMVDLTAPSVALAKGDRVAQGLRAGFGDTLIEDLWLPYFCLSSNLTKGEVSVHTSGPVWRATRASVSIPGLWPPILSEGGDILVDGGVMNNLPVDVMTGFYDGGVIIAVNLRGTVTLPSTDLSQDGVVSGWGSVARKLNPLAKSAELPGIADILLRSTETGNVLAARRMEQDADIVLRPPVSEFGLLAFDQLDNVIEAGYRYALEALPEHLATIQRVL